MNGYMAAKISPTLDLGHCITNASRKPGLFSAHSLKHSNRTIEIHISIFPSKSTDLQILFKFIE